jgi:hypothetical protein
MPKTLTKPDEIRQWVEARAGAPMSSDMPDGTGDTRTLLNITFGQHALNADENEGPDRLGGFELISWDDWLKEFDKQGLAIRVRDEVPGQLDNDFEFVARDGKGKTTSAAKKPAV